MAIGIGDNRANQQNQPAGAAPAIAQPRVGTGYTNIRSYLRPQNASAMGSKIQTGVGAEANKAQQTAQQAATTVGSQIDQGRVGPVSSYSNTIGKALSGNLADSDVQQFQKGLSGQYSGIDESGVQSSFANAQQQANKIKQYGEQTRTETGRQGLLQQFAAKNPLQYNQGKKSLDSLILGKTGQQDLAKTLGYAAPIASGVSSAIAAANEAVGKARTEASATRDALAAQLASTRQNVLSSSEQAFKNAQQAEAKSQADIDELLGYSDTSGAVTNDAVLRNIHKSSGTPLSFEDFKARLTPEGLQKDPSAALLVSMKAPELAKQKAVSSGLMTQEQADLVYNPLIQNTFAKGEGAFFQSPEDRVKYQNMIKQSIQRTGPQNLNRQGFINADQQSQLAALARLAGNENTDLAGAAYKGGKTTLDLGALGEEAAKRYQAVSDYEAKRAQEQAASSGPGLLSQLLGAGASGLSNIGSGLYSGVKSALGTAKDIYTTVAPIVNTPIAALGAAYADSQENGNPVKDAMGTAEALNKYINPLKRFDSKNPKV